jgi:hypothetical protein
MAKKIFDDNIGSGSGSRTLKQLSTMMALNQVKRQL